MFSTADLEIRNVPFPKKLSSDSDLPQRYLLFPFGIYIIIAPDALKASLVLDQLRTC